MNVRIEFAIGLISLTFFTGWSASRKAPGSQNPARETTSGIIVKATYFDCIRLDVVLFEPDPVAMLIVFLGKFTILILAGLQVEMSSILLPGGIIVIVSMFSFGLWRRIRCPT